MAAAITGFQRSNIGGVDGGVEMANKINRFFNSTHPPQAYSVRPPSLATKLSESPPLHRPPACLQPSPSSPSPPLHSTTPYPPLLDSVPFASITSTVPFTPEHARRQLRKLHSSKAVGPL